MPTDSWWRDRAACLDVDPTWFELDRTDAGHHAYWAQALAICGGCPVIDACDNAGRRLGLVGVIYAGKEHRKPQPQPISPTIPTIPTDPQDITQALLLGDLPWSLLDHPARVAVVAILLGRGMTDAGIASWLGADRRQIARLAALAARDQDEVAA
jgi:hypothetical protein